MKQRLRWTHTRVVQLILDFGFSEVTDFHLWLFQHLNIRFHVQHAEAAQTHRRFGGVCVSRVEEQMQSPIISSSWCFHVLLPFLMRPHHYFWQTAAWRQGEAAGCRMQWFHNKSSINTKVTLKTPRGAKKQTNICFRICRLLLLNTCQYVRCLEESPPHECKHFVLFVSTLSLCLRAQQEVQLCVVGVMRWYTHLSPRLFLPFLIGNLWSSWPPADKNGPIMAQVGCW